MANYTSITASNICDAAGNKLASGTVSFQATDASNQPIPFQVGGGGQAVTTPTVATITNGAIANGFQVADPGSTNPNGILYRIVITDTTLNRVVATYSLVSFTGLTFNLDNYVQSGLAVIPPAGGNVNGSLTVGGNLSVTGVITGGAPGAGPFPKMQSFTASTTWTFVHNSGTRSVMVQCFDSNYNLITPNNIQNTDVNTTVVSFLQAQAGYMVVSALGNYTPAVSNPNYIIGNPTSSQSISGDFPFTFGGSVSTPRLNNQRVVDGAKFTTIQAAITDLGGNAGIVVVPSNYAGANPGSVPSNVTIVDYRAGDLAGMRVGDFTAYGLGQTPGLFTRTYNNPSGTTSAGALTGLTSVTTFSGTSTATRGVGNTTAAVVVVQGSGLTTGSGNATLEGIEVNAALTGACTIDTVEQIVSSAGGLPGATGTVAHWYMINAIPVFNIPNGLTLTEVTGIRSAWPQNQGPGTGTITTGYTSFMSGPNNYIDAGTAAGSLALPALQIQGTSASRTGLLLNAVDTNTNKSVSINKTALLTVSTDGIAFPGSVSGQTFLVAPSVGASGVITLPAASATLSSIIASGTAALGTSAIAAGASATVVTVAASGVATTDAIIWSFNAAPGSGYTAGLYVLAYPTSGNVNFIVVNPTAGSLTPAAATLNWRVVR